MVATRREVCTYADLERLPSNVVGELIHGTLYASPRLAERHAKASTVLTGELYSPFQRGRGGPGGWIFYDEPELHFGDDVLVPDIAGWRIARAPEDGIVAFETAPDWLCEVLSPSTAKLDRTVKLAVYARERVPFVWLVDPVQRTLEVFRLEGERYSLAQTASDDAQVRAQPFEELELDLVSLWTGRPRE
ncbi:MAG TPA: Uma2 family endonuclease [Kofleriaceae bacterium]|jgi:Uma2 family endonuclease